MARRGLQAAGELLMRRTVLLALTLCALLQANAAVDGQNAVVDDKRPIALSDTTQHIRNADPREWSSFSQQPDSDQYRLTFGSKANASEWTLRLRQSNVKEVWKIRLNDTELGQLVRNENSIIGFWQVPKDVLRDGVNTLTVATTSRRPDDIEIGNAMLFRTSRETTLDAGQVSVSVTEAGQPVPCRITILQRGQLMTTSATSTDLAAVRPGVIYCIGGTTFGLPVGTYTIVAGRGPEYGIAMVDINVRHGEEQRVQLAIDREVETTGHVSCDTHVHTLTHSGHGDASMQERMLAVAGEALELPIATDHNKHIDYTAVSKQVKTARFFTPVIGNEVTTKTGHFNVFPIASSTTPIPNHLAESWDALGTSILDTPNARVIILNHARDVHNGFRPFDPKHHVSISGLNLDGWVLPANAMEIINSAAQQSDMMTLVHDWMGMLNAGHMLTPVGSSDSHDVARHFVGQGRTYIRCDDTSPNRISIDDAVEAFLAGKVTVSCGLIAAVRVNGQYGPGDLVDAAPKFEIEVDVKGASWVAAESVDVYVNGQLTFHQDVPKSVANKPGVKHTARFVLSDLPQNDVFVVAVVRGPGVTSLHWPIARPYQSTSPDWIPECMAVTGAVWLDVDADKKRATANEYAHRICAANDHDITKVTVALQDFDYAVAVHAAEQLMQHDATAFHATALAIANQRGTHIQQAFQDYRAAWRHSELARATN
jgi:hypothetical protein